jgi:hypothetical protein
MGLKEEGCGELVRTLVVYMQTKLKWISRKKAVGK